MHRKLSNDVTAFAQELRRVSQVFARPELSQLIVPLRELDTPSRRNFGQTQRRRTHPKRPLKWGA